MRLIDEIRTRFLPLVPNAAYVPPTDWAAFDQWFRRSLDAVPVIVADNVDGFVLDRFGLGEHQTEITLADEFPNAVPPFPRMWIEWKPAAPEINSMFERYAALMNGRRTEDGWEIEIIGAMRPVGQRICLLAVRNVEIHSDASGLCRSLRTTLLDLPGIQPAEKDVWDFFVAVPLMTMCFMNCRNIRVNWVPVSEKLVKAFQRRHGTPPSRRIGTLEITPMTKLLSAIERSQTSPSARAKAATHLCRGHFKHYGEEQKLFGRVSGTFFWRPQLRNANVNRDVEHAYRINVQGKRISPKGK